MRVGVPVSEVLRRWAGSAVRWVAGQIAWQTIWDAYGPWIRSLLLAALAMVSTVGASIADGWLWFAAWAMCAIVSILGLVSVSPTVSTVIDPAAPASAAIADRRPRYGLRRIPHAWIVVPVVALGILVGLLVIRQVARTSSGPHLSKDAQEIIVAALRKSPAGLVRITYLPAVASTNIAMDFKHVFEDELGWEVIPKADSGVYRAGIRVVHLKGEPKGVKFCDALKAAEISAECSDYEGTGAATISIGIGQLTKDFHER